jgi:tetratricopeptide (TPR) repeat protein
MSDKGGIANSLQGLGTLASGQGDLDAARTWWQEALVISRELDDKPGIATSLRLLGTAVYMQGDLETCRTMWQEALTICREIGNKGGIANSLRDLGAAASRQGDRDTARKLMEEALAVSREIGGKLAIAGILYHLGAMVAAQGDYDEARTVLQEGLAISREAESQHDIHILGLLGHVERDAGNYSRAGACYRESLLLRQKKGDMLHIGCSLEDLAGLAGRQGQCERAARLLGAAEALYATLGRTLPIASAPEYERTVAASRAALGEEAFTAAWQEGRALTPDQAADYALQPEEPA